MNRILTAAVTGVLGASMLPAETIFGLTSTGALVTFDSATPGVINSSVSITGLAPGAALVGIDFRPSNGVLYGVGNNNQIYTINTATGAASASGAPLNIALSGNFFGVDFNPVADRLRVVSDLDQNLRINVDTGVVATNVSPTGDGTLAYVAGDANFGANPNVVAAGYTNNVKMPVSTELFVIDSGLDIVARQNPPNAGGLETRAPLGIDALSRTSIDISGGTGIAYLASGNLLYTLSTAIGAMPAATLIGSFGTGSGDLLDIAAAPVPEPGTFILISAGLALAAWRRRQ